MTGKLRSKSRAEAQTAPVFSQENWGGGQNSDDPASEIGANELASLTNAVDFGKWIEGHSGSLRESSTSLPGSGTVHSFDFHPTSKIYVLHRGSKLWRAPASLSSWTEIKTYGSSFQAPTESGDASAQIANLFLRGGTSSNTNAGILYWELTNSGSTRTLNLYKDVAKLNLVAAGSRVGDGFMYIRQRNNSGIGGKCTITYTIDDTDAANTYVFTVLEESLGFDTDTSLKKYKNDFILFVKNVSSLYYTCYINLTDLAFSWINAGSGYGFSAQALDSIGSQAAATPYGYRLIFTFCRIVSTAGALDSTLNRKTGVLQFEGGPNDTAYQDISKDYGEFWAANPIAAGNPLTVYATIGGAAGGAVLARNSAPHFTHIGVYRCLDIGVNGIDPVSGLGNNREIYAWDSDVEITAEYFSLTKTDDDIRASLKAGFNLKHRFWTNLPNGECGCIVNDFLFTAARGMPKVTYQQLLRPELIGFYRPDNQFMTFDDGVQILTESSEELAVICSKQTWTVNPKVQKNTDTLAAVFTLTQRTPASRTIGVTDWGSLQAIEGGGFIARCTDASIRIWNGRAWGEDLADKRVRKTMLSMIDGSASGYAKNAYYLWYRTASGDAYNTKCLRLGLGGDAGFGWSVISRATWLFPYLRAGAVIVLDSNSLARLMVLDYATGNMFWIETFTNANSSLTKAWKDKENVSSGTDIAATIRLREFTGSRENHSLQHGESHAYFRAAVPADGYLSGFQVGLSIYVNGSSSAAASATNAPRDGDIQLSKVAEGRRLQAEITTTTSKFQLVGYDSDIVEQDKASIGSQFSDTDEAGYQTALAANLKHWLCRPKPLLNRATGTNYTLAGTAPTAVTGPDGKSYALSFPSGASYTQADTTSYGDFSVGFFCKTVALSSKIFLMDGTDDFYVQFTSNTVMDVNGAGNITVTTIASGWHGFWIVRSGSTVSVYQAGVLLGTVTVATARGGTQFKWNPDGAAMILDAMSVHSDDISAGAVAYHYDDVVNNTGKRLLPLA